MFTLKILEARRHVRRGRLQLSQLRAELLGARCSGGEASRIPCRGPGGGGRCSVFEARKDGSGVSRERAHDAIRPQLHARGRGRPRTEVAPLQRLPPSQRARTLELVPLALNGGQKLLRLLQPALQALPLAGEHGDRGRRLGQLRLEALVLACSGGGGSSAGGGGRCGKSARSKGGLVDVRPFIQVKHMDWAASKLHILISSFIISGEPAAVRRPGPKPTCFGEQVHLGALQVQGQLLCAVLHHRQLVLGLIQADLIGKIGIKIMGGCRIELPAAGRLKAKALTSSFLSSLPSHCGRLTQSARPPLPFLQMQPLHSSTRRTMMLSRRFSACAPAFSRFFSSMLLRLLMLFSWRSRFALSCGGEGVGQERRLDTAAAAWPSLVEAGE
jgi:hypothetical protein